MKRRTFTQALGAILTLPAVPALAIPVPTATAVTVPSQARFWAIYMSGLHGKVTPRQLQVMLNIPQTQAQGIISQLLADGVIKQNMVSGLRAVNPSRGSSHDWTERLKQRFNNWIEDKAEVDEPDAEEDVPSDDVDKTA